MNSQNLGLRAVSYTLLSLATFLALQGLVVVLHEFTHSTLAWALNAMESPRDIVWGNFLTMTGWDEGVDYDLLNAQGRSIQAAAIGFCPLVMHALVVWAGVGLMRGKRLARAKWLFHAVYWFVAANLMELAAYVFMRSFSSHGDIGQFNRGTGLSPRWVFIIGSGLLAWALRVFYRDCLSRLQDLFAKNNPAARRMILLLTSFIIFLWGSGLRVFMHVEGPQRLFGLIGVAAFCYTVLAFRTARVR